MFRPRIAPAIAALGAVLCAGPTAADAERDAAGALRSADTNFWAELIAPHDEEIRVAVAKARQNRQTAAGYTLGQYAAAGTQQSYRVRLLRDAYGMLRYAERLDPDHPDVLSELGLVAAELGHTEKARVALSRYLEVEMPERIDGEAHHRLGVIHARLGEWDRAAVQLEIALSDVRQRQIGPVLCSLASVYMNQGRLAEAIDLLVHEPTSNLRMNGLAQLTLAVAYDRDEQLTAAYDVLDQVIKMSGDQRLLHFLIDQGTENASFTPAGDRYYFRALAYETAGFLAEARTEWQHYADSAGARFRRRALAHIDAIDALLAEQVGVPTAKPQSPGPRPRPAYPGRPSP